MSLETKVVMLEKKVNLISKALELSLAEGTETSTKTRKELRARIRDLLTGNKSAFVPG